VVYLGHSMECLIKGEPTGKEYLFKKDKARMPLPTYIDSRDIEKLLEKRGKNSQRLFATQVEWELALEKGVAINKL